MFRLIKKIWKFLFLDDSVFKEVVEQHLEDAGVEPLIVNATVNLNSELSRGMTEAYAKKFKPPYCDTGSLFSLSHASMRVYIYNISPLGHEKDHPVVGKVKIPGCPVGKPYELAFSLPSLMVQTKVLIEEDGNLEFSPTNGVRVAMDIVNPNNIRLDQWEDTSSKFSTSTGNDLGVKGVFWSLNNPPTEEELGLIKKRYRKYCRMLLEGAGARIYTAKSPFLERVAYFIKKGCTELAAVQEAQREVQITPEHHAAADYMRVTSVWHPVLEKKVKQ